MSGYHSNPRTGFTSGPSLVKCIKIKRALLSEVARAYAFGSASLLDLEQAADELSEAKDNLLKAVNGR